MTSVLLSFALVAAWGSWIPVAQAVPGLRQPTRTLYATAGNLVFAAIALVVGGSAGRLTLGWKEFWLPLAGGLVWTAGSVCAFRATELIGLARASGTWTPLNIIVAFVCGALLFGELSGFSAVRYALLAGCLALVLAGVFLIIGSQSSATAESAADAAGGDPAPAPAPAPAESRSAEARRAADYRKGLLLAVGAGLLWGGYFVPAQWAHVPSQLGNFPLAVGMFAAAVVLAARERAFVRLSPAHTVVQFGAGLLFGVGSVALLDLVPRIGTGAGFTVAQLSLLVNAGVGIWVFRVPAPGSRPARFALAGIALAGVGGTVIGALR
ncbi:MAG TPA: GRP family sugar transporter [Actinospica sp.]|nr:GRP family sugar transporter [Actinospica sp.]